jgi:hypothetical protein
MMLLSFGFAPPPTASAPTTQSSQPAISAALKRRVEDLVTRLNDRDFKSRELAQGELASLGEDIWPLLIEQIPHEREEVNDRIITVVGRPRDPRLRVELAARMLSTGDPERIQSTVYMLFEDPVAVCDLFISRTADAKGILKIVSPPIADQLVIRKKMTEAMATNLPRLREKNPEKAEDLVRLDTENNWLSAEAAALMAIEVLDEAPESSLRGATSQPLIEKTGSP